MTKEEAEKLATAAIAFSKTSEIPDMQEVIKWAFIAGANWQQKEAEALEKIRIDKTEAFKGHYRG